MMVTKGKSFKNHLHIGVVNIKKKKYLLGIIAVILVIPIIYVQSNKIIYANKVSQYLIEEKGYKKEEIKTIEGVWGKKLPAFYVVVIFKDEPNIEYTYFAHSKVGQFKFRSINGTSVSIDELINYESD